MIYPIGSVYQSFEPINGHELEYTDGNEGIIVEWNDCSWQLLDSGTFLRNVNHTTPLTEEEDVEQTEFEHTIDNSGITGGEAEHILTVEEMPTHHHTTPMIKSSDEAGGYGLAKSSYFGNCPIVKRNDIYDRGLILDEGGGQPHNNLPPFITVFMYKRIL